MKTKKIILSSILAILLLLSSLILCSCGSSSTSQKTFELFDTNVKAFKNSTDIFESGTINNMSTRFKLRDFYYYDQNKSQIIDGSNYIALNAYGLNFIEKYYVKLENLKEKNDFSKLDKSVNDMAKSFTSLKQEHEKLKTLGEETNYITYNGLYARYKAESKNFIDKVYNCANNLGDFLYNKTKNNEDINYYIDYNYLQIMNDYKSFFMESSKGKDLNDDDYRNAVFTFAQICGQTTKNKRTLSDEGKASIKTIFTNLNNTRKSIEKSLDKFSFYNYVVVHNGSLSSYAKVSKNAQIYYDRLSTYFWTDNSVLANISAYLQNNIIQ